MKRLLIVLVFVLGMSVHGQKLDSLEIYTPMPKSKKVYTGYTPDNFGKKLDSLNTVYSTNLFIVKFYLDNKQVITSAYAKKSPKKITI